MTSVNPPPQLNIPPELLKDKRTRDYMRQIEAILFQLYNRTGGTSDIPGGNAEDIVKNSQDILINSGLIADNADAILANTDLINDNTDLININSGLIAEIPIYSGFMAQVQFLQRQFDGLPEFTIDTSGFTVDTTFITTDKVIA